MGADALPGIGTAVSAIGDIFGIFNGLHMGHLANQIHPQWQQYQTSKYATDKLSLAKMLYGGLMPGYNNLKQNIDTSQSNFNNNVERNATDSSQALALGGLSQGTTNNAYSDLQTKQEQYSSSMLGNLNDAYDTMTQEGDKSYQSILQKYMMDSQTQNQLRGLGVQNAIGGTNALGANLIAYGNYKKSQ